MVPIAIPFTLFFIHHTPYKYRVIETPHNVRQCKTNYQMMNAAKLSKITESLKTRAMSPHRRQIK
jgi:hypothetical protein